MSVGFVEATLLVSHVQIQGTPHRMERVEREQSVLGSNQ